MKSRKKWWILCGVLLTIVTAGIWVSFAFGSAEHLLPHKEANK